jgi:colicin import membrane protein
MSAAVLDREPGSTPAAVLSALVHAALFTFLFFGISWQSKLPDAVVVELWDRPPVIEPAPAEHPKPEPQVEPKPEPKVEPRVEAKPVKPDIAIEKEKKAPPKKKEEPKKVEPRKAEPAVKIDYDRVMRERMAREIEQVSRTSKPAQPPPVVDAGYANKINAKIKGNIVLPPDIKGNPEAIFDVVQLPTGEVLSARLRKSSGNRAYDDAVERAILKSSPLPEPDRREQFARELQLKFRPVE